MQTVVANGATFDVVDEGSGPPLLLVHGFPLDHTMWARQIAELRWTQRVIAPDLRGFGRSRDASGILPMERHADDLAALLDALGVREPITYCGFSMGGYVAFPFLRRYGERVGRLVLCDTRASADPPDVARAREETADRVLAHGSAGLVTDMLARLFAARTIAGSRGCVEATRRVMSATSPGAVAAALLGMAKREDATSMLATISVPTLVVCGEHDVITPSSEMRAMAAALPHARFVEIAGAGHMAPLEDPEAVNAALRGFLAEG